VRKYLLFALIIAVAGLSYGCAKPVAEVNGEKITQEMYKVALKESMRQHNAVEKEVTSDSLRDAIIQQLIGERLLVQSAKEAKVLVTEDEIRNELERMEKMTGKDEFQELLKKRGLTAQMFRERLKTKMIVHKYINDLVPDDSVSEKDMKDFYKQTPKMFINPKSANVRLIQTTTEAEAQALLNEIKEKKISFDKLADNLQENNKASVTAYGWTDPSFYSQEISEAMKTLKKGTYGGPYKGKDSYFLIRVKDRKAETPKTFAESKDEIKQLLLDQKRNATMLHLIEKRKENSTIKIF